MSDEYLVRGKDGVLHVRGVIPWGASYKDPGEAVKTWWSGKLRFGCAEKMFTNYKSHPCGNAAKYDPDTNGNPTRCGHHSAAAKERKRQKREERDAAERRKLQRRDKMWRLNKELPEIIQKIADGHNDPRGLCLDWLNRRAEADKDA